MPQAFLGVNPGTTVKDAIEFNLIAATPVTGDVAIGTAPWREVNFPGEVAIVAELGVIDAGVTGFDIEIVGSDTGSGSGTNVVSYGHLDTITGSSDNQTRILRTDIKKPFIAALIDHTGTGNVAVAVKVRPADWGQGNTATA